MKLMLNVWDIMTYFSCTISSQSRRYLNLSVEPRVLISEKLSLVTGFKLFDVKGMPQIDT